MQKPKLNQLFTYQDYLTWPDHERWEIIDGIAYEMSPAPAIFHQRISRNLTRILDTFLQEKKCELFEAPTDVVLSEENVIQPDLFVVCDPDKITEKCIQGAPDLIVEILSPSNSQHDRQLKLDLYQRFRVHEYIIINPADKTTERFLLENNYKFGDRELFTDQQHLPINTLADFPLPLWEVFGIENLQEQK